jgi:hypothetical protein
MVRIKRDGADLQFGGAITDLTRQRALEHTRAPGSLIGTKRHALIGVFSIANARLGGPPMPCRRHHVQLLVGT